MGIRRRFSALLRVLLLFLQSLRNTRLYSSFLEYLRAQFQAIQLLRLEYAHLMAPPAPEAPPRLKAQVFPPRYRVLLVGGGHAHVEVLRRLMNPDITGMEAKPGMGFGAKDIHVTIVSRDSDTPYSGMLPGLVSGVYEQEDCFIDLRRVAKWSGARFIKGEVNSIDFTKKSVKLVQGREIGYDVISINVGSVPSAVPKGVTPVKPIDGFSRTWEEFQGSSKSRVVVVGAGAGGVELAMAIHGRTGAKVTVVGKRLLPGHGRAARALVLEALTTKGIVLLEDEVVRVENNTVICSGGNEIHFDRCFWCTQASTESWLGESGLEVTDEGFVKVSNSLQSISNPGVFAVGDCSTMVNYPRPKAGVFAVRQGPPLAENLVHYLRGEDLVDYIPQSEFLGLIGEGDGKVCIASRGSMAMSGDWLWDLKDWIDRNWMDNYKTRLAQRDMPMKCGGCGCKVGEEPLRKVLRKIKAEIPKVEGVICGIEGGDDVAILAAPKDKVLVQTVDHFRAFTDDAFMFGKIAANHCLSDCHAKNARAWTALAIAVVPYDSPRYVEETLYDMLAGACEVLGAAGCALVGGHSSEGSELSLGFVINGLAYPDKLLRKAGVQASEKIILTKPLGTGVLFAANGRVMAKGSWVESALSSTMISNASAGECFSKYNASACTDVTGFGLAGHLNEMLRRDDEYAVEAVIRLDAVPVLPGALECVRMGVQSSVLPYNRSAASESLELMCEYSDSVELLFDPQTAGGLLATVPENRAEECIKELRELGYRHACIIGEVTESSRGPGIKLI